MQHYYVLVETDVQKPIAIIKGNNAHSAIREAITAQYRPDGDLTTDINVEQVKQLKKGQTMGFFFTACMPVYGKMEFSLTKLSVY